MLTVCTADPISVYVHTVTTEAVKLQPRARTHECPVNVTIPRGYDTSAGNFMRKIIITHKHSTQS